MIGPDMTFTEEIHTVGELGRPKNAITPYQSLSVEIPEWELEPTKIVMGINAPHKKRAGKHRQYDHIGD
jgi:hypothetical protein